MLWPSEPNSPAAILKSAITQGDEGRRANSQSSSKNPLLKRINRSVIHFCGAFLQVPPQSRRTHPQKEHHETRQAAGRHFLPAVPILFWLHSWRPRKVCFSGPEKHAAEARIALREGWTLQTSAKVEAKGEVISTPQFAPKGWHEATVPSTVVAALVKDKSLPDPFFGMNLRNFPGVNYPIGGNFSNIAMAPDSPYAVSWWYRKPFALPASYKGKTIWLKFDGINYRANIFLNGKQIAKSDDVAGAWRTYEFNITAAAKTGAENVLAVQAFSPTEHDLGNHFRRLESRRRPTRIWDCGAKFM